MMRICEEFPNNGYFHSTTNTLDIPNCFLADISWANPYINFWWMAAHARQCIFTAKHKTFQSH